MNHKFIQLTESQIYENFDVPYIRKLIEHTDTQFPIRLKTTIHKALYEETGRQDVVLPSNTREISKEQEMVNIPKDLYEQMVQYMKDQSEGQK
jgi:hypothetical protein